MNEKKLIIEIDGVEYPAVLSMGSMKRFKDETGKEISQINGESEWGILFWCCVKSGCAREKINFEMKCIDFLDYCTTEVLNTWVEALKLMDVSKKKEMEKNPKV